VIRDGIGIGVAVGAYGLSFGAVAASAGLSPWQSCALSLLMFTGASQFGMAGVIAAGGSPLSGAATAVLLGTRNAFYGLHLSQLLDLRGLRRLVAAELIIDETTAMSLGRDSPRAGRLGFWSAGISVYCCWNLATLLGALAAHALASPGVLGLDAAGPAAFTALLVPRLRGREPQAVALAAAVLALGTTPLLPVGVPVLLAALAAVGMALRPGMTPATDDDREGTRK
jgi:predicted branched-subunit amino acid permease